MRIRPPNWDVSAITSSWKRFNMTLIILLVADGACKSSNDASSLKMPEIFACWSHNAAQWTLKNSLWAWVDLVVHEMVEFATALHLQRKRQPADTWFPTLTSQQLFFLLYAKGFLNRAFDPFDPPSVSSDSKNSLLFHRNLSSPRRYWCFFPRGGYDMVNQNFKARGQYSYCAFFWCVCSSVGFCLRVQILISQMNTNIYSAEVGAPATSDALPLGQSLLEQQVAAVEALRSCRTQGEIIVLRLPLSKNSLWKWIFFFYFSYFLVANIDTRHRNVLMTWQNGVGHSWKL